MFMHGPSSLSKASTSRTVAQKQDKNIRHIIIDAKSIYVNYNTTPDLNDAMLLLLYFIPTHSYKFGLFLL
jgi:hypothetical protein